MAYLRDRREELTGYQAGSDYRPTLDLGNDFVMVYGIDPEMPERVKHFKDAGYVVHLMTGIAWGQYGDYLDGKIDGRDHWDESQYDREGKKVLHNPTIPYMVPTVAFGDYLTEKMKVAVDAGVEAIHVEEPEYFEWSGYSPAFKREWEIYYHEPWVPPHESADAHYKASKLKSYLYARIITRVSCSLKEYAKVKYNRNLRFYVPTHSLISYIQWKVVSPEAGLIDIPTVDGCISQIWTGTAREANVYNGIFKERTFETGYLEYGIMQELVKGTGRRMWFLHDPIEDFPTYEWENYELNYLKTLVASLLHPGVHHYEVCPWPHRVFEGKYPLERPFFNWETKDETAIETEKSKPIPQHYSTLLSNIFQMLGDMDQKNYYYEGINSGIGVLMADSGLFQRTMPDGVVNNGGITERLAEIRHKNDYDYAPKRDEELMEIIAKDNEALFDFEQNKSFPSFFGMVLPLLKYGLPIRPVQLDNVKRYTGYLSDYNTLILSYEYMKPETPDLNTALVTWIMQGGTLIYIGDGSDPYHEIKLWWKDAGYNNPAEHLFDLLGLGRNPADGTYNTAKGKVLVINKAPARLSLSETVAANYREKVRKLLLETGCNWEYRNDITLHRGPYIISAVMDESINEEPKVFNGIFTDMLSDSLDIVKEKVLKPDENTVLFDFATIENEDFRIIGTSARINSFDITEEGFTADMKAADRIKVFARVRLPKAPTEIKAFNENGEEESFTWAWDEETRTVLYTYESANQPIVLKGKF